MKAVYEEVRTPYKYGLVVAPENNDRKIDCPTVFREGERWYMTYVVYDGRGGQDGRGYETWLAESDDLLTWRTLGRILSFRDGSWDANQRGGFPALIDMEWGGSYALQSFKGRRWMTYIGGPGRGYEAINAPLSIGLAWTSDDPGKACEWQAASKPVLASNDPDAAWWESLTLYKSMVYWDKSECLGAPFVLYYNAGGIHPETGLKGERIGIALSKDMRHWHRYTGNPVFAHEAQGTITGDAQIQRMDDLYVMFYFSAFHPDRPYKAFNTFACSYDLVTWDDWQGDDLIYPTKEYDECFAHKSFVVKHDGTVYHFYCAVNDADQRGIALATSKPMGRSSVHFPPHEAKGRRTTIGLEKGWDTWLEDAEHPEERKSLHRVNLPHNWDDYYGYRQLLHGNLHGTAVYSKHFELPELQPGRRCFLRLEGAGTYASVQLNGHDLGCHAVGRTTLTLDITQHLVSGGSNELKITTEHPEMIADMPWVCGGCSSEWGFSEGSQPLGLFRPVVLEITDDIRIDPFGVHIWNDEQAEKVFIETEVTNHSPHAATVAVVNKFSDALGVQVFRLTDTVQLAAGETKCVHRQARVEKPRLWSLETPYLYTLTTLIKRDGKTTDEITTPFGIRTVSWPVRRNDGDGRFLLNGKPVFINGICEYEHLLGQSHAFTLEQVASRVKQIKNAGFNAFRDAHQPHHLYYQRFWDKEGILFWPQFSAHIWYDTPEFRANFLRLLRQWVRERRNSPSVVMWGLQNESTLPRDFAEECCEIIREMDPTARTMRVITTCNGGSGTDWNVVQNWSGTYGGDINSYGEELARPDQLLNGEYGAWRSIGLHSEPDEADKPDAPWSEEHMCQLLEKKIRLAEGVSNRVCGHFLWLFNSHDNPGRRQPDEAYRTIDKIGPCNYKGLVTPWEEPLDAYYLYRANYTNPHKDPMVYLVSHTWPARFVAPRRATVEAYSNCDSVILYNDAANAGALGVRRKGGKGEHFVWKGRDIRYNVLRAVGYCDGHPAAEDVLVLDNLPRAPHFDSLYHLSGPMLKAAEGYTYLCRINCGGDAYTDIYGQRWEADDSLRSHSWGARFTGVSPFQASQRTISDPIRGVRDWPLFQSFRFGRHELRYCILVPDGDYRVECYFAEPWHGTGGGAGTDCEGLRIFDVAANGRTIIDDLDLWAEAGHAGAVKRVADVTVQGGVLQIDFPETKAGQALIAAIAVARKNDVQPEASAAHTANTAASHEGASLWSWAQASRQVLAKTPAEMLPEEERGRKVVSYEAEEAAVQGNFEIRSWKERKGVFFGAGEENSLAWTFTTGLAQIYALRFKYMNLSGKPIDVMLQIVDSDGNVVRQNRMTFPETSEKWRMISTTTGGYINAGTYKAVISAPQSAGLAFNALEIQ